MSLRKLMERDLFIPLNWPCKPQKNFQERLSVHAAYRCGGHPNEL